MTRDIAKLVRVHHLAKHAIPEINQAIISLESIWTYGPKLIIEKANKELLIEDFRADMLALERIREHLEKTMEWAKRMARVYGGIDLNDNLDDD